MVVLLGMQNYEPYDQQFCLASNQICQCDTPSKIFIFVWRLLQNRLSKRDLLVSRGVIVANNDVNCVLCECEKVATTCSFLVIFPIMCGLLLTHGQELLDRCQNIAIDHFLLFASALKGKRYHRSRKTCYLDGKRRGVQNHQQVLRSNPHLGHIICTSISFIIYFR